VRGGRLGGDYWLWTVQHQLLFPRASVSSSFTGFLSEGDRNKSLRGRDPGSYPENRLQRGGFCPECLEIHLFGN